MSSQVILIHKDDEYAHLLELNLELYVGAAVIPMPRAQKAIELLKTLPKADLIITADEIGHEKTSLDIYRYVQKYERKIPIISMGYNHLLKNKVQMTKEKSDWKSVVRLSAKVLGIAAGDVAKKVVPEFYPLELKYFQSVDSVGTDIYIRIPRSNKKGGHQYIRRFPAHEKYEQAIIEKYKEHGVTHLYVPKDKRLLFGEHFSAQIIEKLHQENLEKIERIVATSDAYYGFADQVKSTGLTDKAIELAQVAIESMTLSIQEVPSLQELLKELRKNSKNFLFNHSLLLAYVGHHVLNHLLMGTKEQQNNFVFVAFFHDIMLKNDEMAQIHHDKDMKKFDLAPHEKKIVENHALEACNILREYPQVPMGAPMAIKQHHCTLDGRGFIDFAGERITPLAQVFRVVEDYVYAILIKDDDSEERRKEILERLKKKYTKFTYKEVVDVLETI